MALRLPAGNRAANPSPDAIRSFVEAKLGTTRPALPTDEADETAYRDFLRAISTRHEHWSPSKRSDGRVGREPTGDAADSFADEVRSFVRAIRGEPTPFSAGSTANQPPDAELQEFLGDISTCHERYNPNEPRDAIGQWTSNGGGGGGSGGGRKPTGGPAPKPEDGSRYYLPAETRGEWEGPPGNSKFRLEKPVIANGKTVTHIEFKNGLPDLDKFALPGKTATIILTGDSKADIRNAKTAWQKLNPGKPLPADSVFHHDLLNAAEHIVTIDGKKTKVLVGKMPAVDNDVHRLFHKGSASAAREMYEVLGTDVAAVKKLATKEASLAGKKGTIVARAAEKIVSGVVPKGIRHLVGRSIARVIPLVSTGLAIIEFSDNVEAHGVAGAVARATPVLGDLISFHDLGSELAKQIRDDASAASDSHLKALNAKANEAWDKASQQTIDAFNELAPTVKVTNPYSPDGYVEPKEVADAVESYRQAMQAANSLQAHKARHFDFSAAAARAKQELKERLTNACQKRAPQTGRPAL
ncbi:MAG TPA: hypothetical protein VHY91_19125 [Pirellulales bacterium]|jgi:hypothetical protein|nr:hypothetical protein [Pirellulales bacterium]